MDDVGILQYTGRLFKGDQPHCFNFFAGSKSCASRCRHWKWIRDGIDKTRSLTGGKYQRVIDTKQ